jgi:hypothetical protein
MGTTIESETVEEIYAARAQATIFELGPGERTQ